MKRIFDFFLKHSHFVIVLYSLFIASEFYQTTQLNIQGVLQEKQVLEQNIQDGIRKNREAEEFSKNLDTSRLKIEELRKQIDEVQKQLPSIISDTDVLELFSRETSAINIKNVNLKPMGEEEKDFYFSKRYSLKGEGTFLQFLIFFEKIANQERIYNVSSLTIKKEQEKSKGRFQILDLETVMEAFRYNSAKTRDLEKTEPKNSEQGQEAPRAKPRQSGGEEV